MGAHEQGKYGRESWLIERMGDKRKVGKRSIKQARTGMAFYIGSRAQAWCYLCNSEHRFTEPCIGQREAVAIEDATSFICTRCGEKFAPTPYDRSRTYCSPMCRDEARRARKRLSK